MDKKQISIIGCSILLAVSLYNLTETQSTILQKANLKSYISWEDWVVKYNKEYLTPEETKFRLKNFNENLEYIAYKNTKENNTFKYGVNKFADLTNEEFKNLYINKRENFYKALTKKFNSNGGKINQILGTNKNLSSMDWRDTGCVKNDSIDRKGCPGASYAITAVEALSSTICANQGYFSIKFSVQEIIDCSRVKGNNGCESGFSGYAFDYIKTFGICTDNNYPYKGIEGTCYEKKCWQKANIKGWEIFKMIDGQTLESLLNQHPVIALIDASHLRLYESGIYNGYCTTNFNSHVLVVGYGTLNGNKYWILKNSWGGDWGEQGYFRIERLNSGKGKCGILTLVESVDI